MKYSIQSGKTIDEAVEKALLDLKISRDEAKIEVIEEPSKGLFGLIGGKEAIVKVVEKMDTKDILESIFDSPSFTQSDAKVEEKTLEKTEHKKKTNVIKSEELQDKEEAMEKDQSLEPAVSSLPHHPIVEEARETSLDEAEVIGEKEELREEEKDAIIREFISTLMRSFSLDYELSIEHRDKTINVSINGKKEETGIIIGKRGATLDSIQYILSLILNGKTQAYHRVILDCSNYRQKREATLENLAHKMAKKALSTNRSVRLEPMTAQERRIIHAALGSVEGVSTHSEGKDPYRRVVIQKERQY